MPTSGPTILIALLCALYLTLASASTDAGRANLDVHRHTFNGHKLYSLDPTEDDHLLRKLLKLRSEIDIDYWNEPELGTKINFRVPPKYQPKIENFLNQSSLNYAIVTSDLQKWIDRERSENVESDFLSGRQDINEFKLDYYHTYEEIYTWMEHLEKRFPQYVKVIQIGKTYEGKSIKAVKIGIPKPPGRFYQLANNETKPAIWLDGGIHARLVTDA